MLEAGDYGKKPTPPAIPCVIPTYGALRYGASHTLKTLLIDHGHTRANRHAGVKVDNVLIHQTDTAGRNIGTDRIRFGRAVDTEQSVAAVLVEI